MALSRMSCGLGTEIDEMSADIFFDEIEAVWRAQARIWLEIPFAPNCGISTTLTLILPSRVCGAILIVVADR